MASPGYPAYPGTADQAPADYQAPDYQPAEYQPGQAGYGYPAAPVSAPGYGPPPTSAMPMASGPPTSGVAYGQPGYGQPPAPRSRTVPLLAALVVVFFVATAVFSALFITKSGAYNKKVSTLKNRDTAISSQQNQLKDLKQQLQSTQDQLKDETQKATGTQNQVDELNHEKQVISQCLNLLGQAADAANAGDKTTANNLLNQANPICAEADKYLA
jgi:uncharacterized protein HemX